MSDTVLAIIELEKFPQLVAQRGAWLAHLFGCKLRLLLCDPSSRVLREQFMLSSAAQEISEAIDHMQRELLAELGEAATESDKVEVSVAISHDRPAYAAIVSHAADMSPRFVVKGTQYHSSAARASFTFTDWQLIRELSVPLWLVKECQWLQEPAIVAAVDAGQDSPQAAAQDDLVIGSGKTLAEKCGGKLLVLHTYQSLIEIGRVAKYMFKPGRLPFDKLDADVRDAHRQKLDALAQRHKIDAEYVFQLPGRTRDVLPAFARDNSASLVIIGAAAGARNMQNALGSTAESVLDHLPCDVLVTRLS